MRNSKNILLALALVLGLGGFNNAFAQDSSGSNPPAAAPAAGGGQSAPSGKPHHRRRHRLHPGNRLNKLRNRLHHHKKDGSGQAPAGGPSSTPPAGSGAPQ